jgi:predicted nucleotidyltransferase
MRLTADERRAIVDTVARVAGHEAQVRLFGSRTRDDARGGDIDLAIDMPYAVDRPALLAARIEAALAEALGEQKIDVLLSAPNLQDSAVHRAARAEGIPL